MDLTESIAPRTTIDWTQFRPGDKVRITFEGTWRGVWDDDGWGMTMFVANDGRKDDGCAASYGRGTLMQAASAELIERPFPAAGKLFQVLRANATLYISLGRSGYRVVRYVDGTPNTGSSGAIPWSAMEPDWIASIEVLDT